MLRDPRAPIAYSPPMVDATQSLAFAFGIGALVAAVSARLRIPAVLPLLVAGVLAGPSGLGIVDLASVAGLFRAIVALSIGLLVFEGGLHLDRKELGRAPRAVVGLLTLGAAATLGGSMAIGMRFLGLDWPIALLFGALLVVTGPTVVQPILRAVRLAPRLRAVLGAEAILIDPIGVLCSVAALEVALAYYRGAFEGSWPTILAGFGVPFLSGVAVGAAAGALGLVVFKLLGARLGPNVAAVGICMLAIGVGELITHEGGLVAATVAGVILSNLEVVKTSDLRRFKEQIATILVGMLFVLLASSFDVSALEALDEPAYLAGALILFAVRPVAVLLATFRSRLAWRERAFASLFAPRGVVAASVAALTVTELEMVFAPLPNGPALAEQARLVSTTIVLLIAGSVLWATLAAWPLAWILGVLGGAPSGVAIVGAHGLGRALGRTLRKEGIEVILLDSNASRVLAARACGLDAEVVDATDTTALAGALREREIGWVIGWTGNADVDRVVERWGRATFGEGHASSTLPTPPGSSDARPFAAAERPAVVRELDGRCADESVAVRIDATDAAGATVRGASALLSIRDGIVTMFGAADAPPRRTRVLRLVAADREAAPADRESPTADAAGVAGAVAE